jgi:predicted kinase
LRPAYFDAEPSAPAETASEPEFEPAVEAPSAEQPSASEVESSPRGNDMNATDGSARRRRRRSRGGRGRRKPGRAAPAVAPEAGAAAEPADEPQSPAPQAEPAAAALAPVSSRSLKGIVVLAIGLPGSGKSSWFKRHNITPLSSDLLRSLLFDDPHEQRFQDLVFSNLRSMLRARLIARRPANYVDATNLTPHERHSWIKLAKDFGYEPQAVYFDVPAEVCLERNRRRSRVVAEDVMMRMAAKLKPPTFEEGFAKITVVRVKKKTGEPAE